MMKKLILKRMSLLLALMLLCLAGAGCSNSSPAQTAAETPAPPSSPTEAPAPSAAPAEEPAPSESAEVPEGDGYLYGYTAMSFADFWYGELTDVAACDTFDPEDPDLTATSEEYRHFSYSSADDPDRFAGVQKNTWDNDSGMYDAVSRATVGYGLFRAGFAHTVEVTMDSGEKKIMSHEIVADETAPTGYRIDLNTEGIEGIVLTDNTRLDTEKTVGYTPDTKTTYAGSIENGGGGYQITGLKKVPVKVKKATADEALRLQEEGKNNEQVDAFLDQYQKITFEEAPSAYAYKELYASGVYGAREINEEAEGIKDPGRVYLGDGSNGTKAIAHGDGYADLTMFLYYEDYDGYTRGSIGSLDEETLNTLYDGEEKPTYAENKENADKLAAFMDYALHFQGAKLQWAGEDNTFDTEDDVFTGEMLHKDAYFSFNHGNYIEISITNDFERFNGLGNGSYRITMIADGYRDVSAEAENLVLDYHTPAIEGEDIPAVGDDRQLNAAINVEGVKVSLDENVQAAYMDALANAETYSLSYMEGEGRKAKEIVVCENAADVTAEGNIYTITFDVSTAESLPEDIHYFVTIAPAVDGIAAARAEFHYAPGE